MWLFPVSCVCVSVCVCVCVLHDPQCPDRLTTLAVVLAASTNFAPIRFATLVEEAMQRAKGV